MCTAFLCVNIITKSKYIFFKFIDILKSNLNLNSIFNLFKIDKVIDCFFAVIQLFNIRFNSIWFIICYLFFTANTLIFIYNCKIRIKISCFMKSAFNRLSLKSYFFKYFIIWQKCYCRTCIIFSACTNLL